MLKPLVLYVDDEIISISLFQMFFSSKFEILTAINGELGLIILKENPDIHIVFSDFHMPIMNGMEFIEKAKRLYPDKAYFIVSSIQMNNEIHKAIKDNLITGFISKPINKQTVEKAIISCE